MSYYNDYDYCPYAYVDPKTRQPIKPCDNRVCEPTPPNPCNTQGCCVSPNCTSGTCRLTDLNHYWKCCRCGRGANTSRWCRHRKDDSPDTLCYHVVCPTCTQSS